MKRYAKSLGAGLVLALVLAWCLHAFAAPPGGSDGMIPLPDPGTAPVLPPDIDVPGGAPAATLQQAAAFAWQEFIALTWPAQPDSAHAGQYVRDAADANGIYGAAAAKPDGPPLVWETFRGKVEIYPGTTAAPRNGYVVGQKLPHGAGTGLPDFGYNDPPQYNYATYPQTTVTGPCAGEPANAPTAWINLDEQKQIGLDQMYAGVLPGSGVPDENQRILFLAKANKTAYTYVLNPANFGVDQIYKAVWNQAYPPANPPNPKAYNPTDNQTYNQALANFQTYRVQVHEGKPASLQGPYVSFPAGTVEVKSAWRPLTQAEQESGRFHMAMVRYYEQATKTTICYRQAAWGMLSLHIIQKTPTAPYFIYATFSQADNIQAQAGGAVEDENGAQANRPFYDNGLDDGLEALGLKWPPYPPRVQGNLATATAHETYNIQQSKCTTPGQRLYYVNTVLADNNNKPLPLEQQVTPQGPVCIDQRANPIPPEIIAANQQAHAAIDAYNSKHNNGARTPWNFYKLINVQSKPIDKAPGIYFGDANDPDVSHRGDLTAKSTYYQANEVVETNFNLQLFSGILTKAYQAQLMTDFYGSKSFPNGQFQGQPAKNTFFLHKPDGSQVTTFNMGGCMGCHGNAQQAGDDFSFILNGGRNDTPDAFELPLKKSQKAPPAIARFRYRLP